jgi:hypothetical protein
MSSWMLQDLEPPTGCVLDLSKQSRKRFPLSGSRNAPGRVFQGGERCQIEISHAWDSIQAQW